MDNFHLGLEKFVGSPENLLNLMMFFENIVFVRISGFAYLYERIELSAVYSHSYNYVLQNYF